jgi:hypothetical protein
LVKIHRSYTVEEIASLFEVHRNTVRQWIKDGLPTTDKLRPLLILGHELSAFVHARRAKNKRTCQPDEMYCMRCRAPRVAAGAMADYDPVTGTSGNLTAICSVCEAMMNRRVSLTQLSQIRGHLEVTTPHAQQRIGESAQPCVNSDFRKVPNP